MKKKAEGSNSNSKTRTELISWRRNKIIELKSQGYNQEEIAQILQVTPSLISMDMQAIRKEAMENIQEYTTKQYPIWFKACLVGIQNSMKVCWNIAQNAQDNKEKMMALEHYRQFYIDMLAMVGWRGQYALEEELDKMNRRQSKYRYREGELAYPKPGEQFSPYVYHSPEYIRRANEEYNKKATHET